MLQRYKSQVIYAKNLTNMFWRKRQDGCGAVGGFFFLAFLGNLPMALNWKRLLFPGFFLAFGSFGTGEGLLWYGICARCSKRLPTVRDAFSEALRAQNRLLRYGRNIRCAEQPPVVRDAFSGAQMHAAAPSVFLRAKGRKWQILDCLLRKISYLCEWSTKRL